MEAVLSRDSLDRDQFVGTQAAGVRQTFLTIAYLYYCVNEKEFAGKVQFEHTNSRKRLERGGKHFDGLATARSRPAR